MEQCEKRSQMKANKSNDYDDSENKTHKSHSLDNRPSAKKPDKT